MANFLITGPDGKKYKVNGPDRDGAIAAFQQAMRGRDENVIATGPDGGRFVKGSDGSISFASPGYSTSDPETVKRLMDGEGVKEVVQSTTDRMTIDQNPVGARANEFVRGVPFVGTYADEAVGMVSPKARDAMRQTSDAMQRENPGQTTALNIAGGVAGSVPIAVAGAPTVMSMAPKAPAMRALGGGILGAAAGGGEGTVAGYGEGMGDERVQNAQRYGTIGAMAGGALGATLPLAGDAFESLIRRFRGEDVQRIAQEFGVTRDSARVLKTAFENNDQNAVKNILRAGDEATLADAGRSGQALLDAAAQTGGKPLNIVDEAVSARANRSMPKLTGVLDEVLGAPEGPRAAALRIADSTQPERTKWYGRAHNTPIDYASPQGRQIEALMQRIDPKDLKGAVEIANKRLRWDGGQRQILLDVADDGSMSMREMPGVRQLDELKKALNQIDQSNRDMFGRPTDGGLAGQQANAVRDATIDATGGAEGPYARAVAVGGDKIDMDKGLKLGLQMLRDTDRTTRAMVTEDLASMPKDARQMVRVGLRSYIDEMLGRVKMIASNPDAMEARQAMQALRMMTSDNSKAKLHALLGPEDFGRIMPQLDEAIATQNMVASVADNSRTAVRQSIQGQVGDITEPGLVGKAARGQPVDATQRLVQTLMATTPGDDAARQHKIWSEIASVLSDRRGSKSAKAALNYVNKAISGTELSEAEIRLIANQYLLGAASSGSQAAQQSLVR